MKKIAITLSLSLFALSTQAAQADAFYLGFKSGWSSLHHGVRQFANLDQNGRLNDNATSANQLSRNSVAFGVYGGYQLHKNFALEGGYDYLGQMKVSTSATSDNALFKHNVHSAALNFKANYALTEKLDLFARAGAAVVQNRYKFQPQVLDSVVKMKQHRISPLVGAGLEYHISSDFSLRLDYQWLSRVADYRKVAKYVNNNGALRRYKNIDYRPDAHSVAVGLAYSFGGAKPKGENVNKHFEFSEDVLFDFANAKLKSEASAVLDSVYHEITQQNLNDTQVKVSGYADRLGSKTFNRKLSQKRADNVAAYLVSKGDMLGRVQAVGYGSSNTKTGQQCDNIRNRRELIRCLAPERRVTIDVKGVKAE